MMRVNLGSGLSATWNGTDWHLTVQHNRPGELWAEPEHLGYFPTGPVKSYQALDKLLYLYIGPDTDDDR